MKAMIGYILVGFMLLAMGSSDVAAQFSGKTCAYITQSSATNVAQDEYVKAKLASWGLTVTVYDTKTQVVTAAITDAIKAELMAKSFVFISEVVSSGDLTQMRAFDQKIVASDAYIARQSSLGLVASNTSGVGTYFSVIGPGGTATSGDQGSGNVMIVDNTSSPLAAGYSQGTTVPMTSGSGANTGEVLNYTLPTVTPIIPIACVAEDATQKKLVVYGIEPKTAVYNSTGTSVDPALKLTKRFAAWNIHANGYSVVAAEGWNLLKAAITWVLASPGTAVGQTAMLPRQYALAQNFPNPFNPATEIEFTLPHEETARLTVYNVLGETVATLVTERLEAGTHRYSFDATPLNSGVYFYTLKAGSFSLSKKMMLLK